MWAIYAQEEPVPPAIANLKDELGSLSFYKVSAEEEKKFLEKLSPETRNELLDLKKIDPKAYNKIIWKSRFNFEFNTFSVGSFFSKDKEEAKKAKEASEMEIYTQILGAKIQHANGSERDKLKKELRSKLDKLFEMKQAKRKKELEQLRDKISELSKSIDKRQMNKESIIQRRMEELTGESEYLKWK